MSPPFLVEVLGPWLRNKGDVLNLWAVSDRVSGSYPLVASSNLGAETLPARPILHRVIWPPDPGAFSEALETRSPSALEGWLRHVALSKLAPRWILRARGLERGRDISALLDCSGYAYGDVWSTNRVRWREAYYSRLKRQGALIVMLPQALGPFEDPSMREAATDLFRHFDLMFARDGESLRHLRSLDLDTAAIGIAPDITHLLSGIEPDDPAAWASRVCIVPNTRMLDRTDRETGEGYVGFVEAAIRVVRSQGLEPVLMVHEENDLPLARQVRDAMDFPVAIVDEDARVSKGILGACYAVIGSRYHAIISALSQGTPVLGTSWSHKYAELFDDYECSHNLASPADPIPELVTRLREFLLPERRTATNRTLLKHARAQKEKVEAMWARVEARMPMSVLQRAESTGAAITLRSSTEAAG